MLQNHLPPNFDFSSDIGHFVLKILDNLKNVIRKKITIAISRGRPLQNFELGNASLRAPPPGGDADAGKARIMKQRLSEQHTSTYQECRPMYTH